MIAVVADDFSGAAELAGIGFAHGLASEIHTEFAPNCLADLVALDTDSRSCPGPLAARRVAEAVASLRKYRPAWIFKKVDSVLRGPVLAELRAMLAATGKRRAILVPANPSRGRIIRDRCYLVEGVPIHRSAFAADPEHPAQSSDVLALLGSQGGTDVSVVRHDQDLPRSGIIVGEASTQAEIMRWSEIVDESTLAAGAADYFAACLSARGLGPSPPADPKTSEVSKTSEVCGGLGRAAGDEWLHSPRTLFVCGSAAAWAQARRDECARYGIPVIPMPQGVRNLFRPTSSPEEKASPRKRFLTPSLMPNWAGAARAALDRAGIAMLTMGDEPGTVEARSPMILSFLVEAVAELLGTANVGRLFVEGGRTASALVRRMGWTQASVCRQYAPGVVAMQCHAAPRSVITVKPGSYSWPDEVWRRVAPHD